MAMDKLKSITRMASKKLQKKGVNVNSSAGKKVLEDTVKDRIKRGKRVHLNRMDDSLASTKIRKGIAKAEDFAEKAISEASLKEVDKKAGEFMSSAGKRLKKAGVTTKNIKNKVKGVGSWVKEHPVKTAAGAAAVGGGAYAVSKSRDDDIDRQLKRIKAKPASERTPSEKRLLRLMED